VIIEGHDALAAAMIQCKQRLNRPALVRTCARKIQGIAASLPLLAMTGQRETRPETVFSLLTVLLIGRNLSKMEKYKCILSMLVRKKARNVPHPR
jgi:hypothetical protein